MSPNLDIERVNLKSPYTVSLDAGGESLVFSTDHGIIYKISFIKDSDIFDGLTAYHFMLHSSNRPVHGHKPDDKIRETVFAIIEAFLAVDNKVVVYICDARDDMQESRQKLFVKWFNDGNARFGNRFVMHTVCYESAEFSFYGGLISLSDNPNIERYVEILDRESRLLADDK